MPDRPLHDLHSHLRNARFRRMREKESAALRAAFAKPKSYDRMPQIKLPEPAMSRSFAEVLARRATRRRFSDTPITYEALGHILGRAVRFGPSGSRPYPSGGGRFPIETYVLTIDDRRACHYRPDLHALEYLWDLPEAFETANLVSDVWAEAATAMLVFTAQWDKSFDRYDAFALELTLLEAGHMSQNVLLASAEIDISACPYAGFKDATLNDLMDVGPEEQVVHTVLLGNTGK